MKRTFALSCAAVVIAGLSACSGEVEVGSTDDSDTLDSTEIEEQISSAYEDQVGRAPASVTCDDEVDAEVDATTTCVVDDEGESDAEVTVTEVTDDGADFDIEFAYSLVEGPTVAEQVSTQVGAEVGREPQSVECEPLASVVGAETSCLLSDRGDEYDVAVTATDVQGTNVDFDIQVAAEPN